MEHIKRNIMSNYYMVPKSEQISLGWADEANGVVFGGISWSGHFAGLTACHDSDARILVLESRLEGERAQRGQNREKLNETNRKVYHALLGHEDFGEDCPLLARWGYTRRSDQDSGLTRGATEPSLSGTLN